MDILKPIQDNWAVVAAAPWAFVAFVLFGIMIGRFWQSGVISSLNGRLDLKNDVIAEYERKLGASSPDEAKHKMEALERRLQAIEPRSLSQDQFQKMVAILARQPGTIEIIKDMGSPQASRLHSQLEKPSVKAGGGSDRQQPWVSLGRRLASFLQPALGTRPLPRQNA